MSITQTALKEGTWGDYAKWELFAGQTVPPPELITAVFCVAIDKDGKVVLARSGRGWGLLGGHVEDGESVDEALTRESQEEGGFTPDKPQMFAYKKVTSSRLVQHQNPSKYYPYPTSYMVYYWAITSSPITQPFGLEIIESASFTLEEVKSFNIIDLLQVVELGYELFLHYSN